MSQPEPARTATFAASSQRFVSVRSLGLAARSLLLAWEKPLLAGLLALGCYALVANLHGGIFAVSASAYFNLLADAFLHGQLALRVVPSATADLVFYNNQYYLYWPPFPAVVLMPFVAVFGSGFSDIAFTIVVGALNVALTAGLLRAVNERLFALSQMQRAALVLFFALGTAHFTLAPRGRVWFTSQLIGIACVLLAYLAVLRLRGWRAFTLAGLALGCAAVTRNNLLFTGLWPAVYLLQQHWQSDRRRIAALALMGLTPMIIIGALLLAYNQARFGSVTDVGLAHHIMNVKFISEYQQYGAFHLHYLPINLYYQFIFYPLPFSEETFMGGSLFLMSPLFFAAFWAFRQSTQRITVWVLLISCVLVYIPIGLLMGTGWMTYGPRYTLDFSIPLLLLTALGMRCWPSKVVALAVAASCITYMIGILVRFP